MLKKKEHGPRGEAKGHGSGMVVQKFSKCYDLGKARISLSGK